MDTDDPSACIVGSGFIETMVEDKPDPLLLTDGELEDAGYEWVREGKKGSTYLIKEGGHRTSHQDRDDSLEYHDAENSPGTAAGDDTADGDAGGNTNVSPSLLKSANANAAYQSSHWMGRRPTGASPVSKTQPSTAALHHIVHAARRNSNSGRVVHAYTLTHPCIRST